MTILPMELDRKLNMGHIRIIRKNGIPVIMKRGRVMATPCNLIGVKLVNELNNKCGEANEFD